MNADERRQRCTCDPRPGERAEQQPAGPEQRCGNCHTAPCEEWCDGPWGPGED